jgi:hypothetical protein
MTGLATDLATTNAAGRAAAGDAAALGRLGAAQRAEVIRAEPSGPLRHQDK